MNKPKIAVITGANKGLGLSLVRALCRGWGEEGRIYLMARDEARGLAARRQLEREGLHPLFCPMDLTDSRSIETAARSIGSEQGGILPPDVKPKMPDDAAHDVLWAGLLPSGTAEPYGELLQYRHVLPWN